MATAKSTTVSKPAAKPAAKSTAPTTSTPTPSASEDKTLGLVAHILLIVSWWLGPLILWVIKKEQGGFVEHHSREALNFGITLTIAYIASWIIGLVLAFVTAGLGFILPVLVSIAGLVFGIIAAIAANKGDLYRYPVSLRLVKGPA